MNTNDNFDNLWSNLKEQVKAARERIKANEVKSVLVDDIYSGSIRVGAVSYGSAFVSMARDLAWSAGLTMNAAHLREHAANCLAAADELDEQAATKEALSQATPKP